MTPAIHCTSEVKMVSVEDLKPHPKNTNKHGKDQIKRLAKVLDYQGFRYPIKVSNLSGFITSGHARLEAAIVNRWAEVPVQYQDYESETQELADLTADNAIASWSELDLAAVNAQMLDFGPDFDIDLLGIKDFKIDLSEVLPDPEEEKEKQIKLCKYCGEPVE